MDSVISNNSIISNDTYNSIISNNTYNSIISNNTYNSIISNINKWILLLVTIIRHYRFIRISISVDY